MRIGDVITRAAKYNPDKLATVFKDVRLTYRELNERVNKVGNAILKLGIGKEDRVGIICHNSHFYQEIFFGTSKTGAVITTINWRMSSRELEFIINDAEVKLLFIAERYWGQVEPIKKKLSTVKKFIVIGDRVPGTLNYEDFISSSSIDEINIEIDPHDTFWQLYTSGTTGRPKGVLLTHRNLYADAEHNTIENRLNRNGMVSLHLLPMFHVAAKEMIFCAYVNATLVIMDKFDSKEICGLVEREKCTHITMAPTMWKFLIDYQDLDKYNLSSLKVCGYRTSPMPVVLTKMLMKRFRGISFYSSYGLTEGGSVTILPADQHVLDGPEYVVKRLGSLGRPMIGVDIRIVDERGQDCPPGTIGEITVRADNVMKGYWKLPEETGKALRDGWLHTGDMGYWDEFGYLYMADRKKDMIISGGENIYPNEVEQVIREMEGVVDVAVIGVPDDVWGESVKAIIVKTPGCKLNKDEVIKYCKQNIASYKKPKSVDFVDELPRNPVGKVLKRILREPYWKGREKKV